MSFAPKQVELEDGMLKPDTEGTSTACSTYTWKLKICQPESRIVIIRDWGGFI
jgi:hypothetical protein